MPFIKQGIAPIAAVKCGCGQTLDSVNTACPKCGRNLRPLSNPQDQKDKKDAKSDTDLLLHLTQTNPGNSD